MNMKRSDSVSSVSSITSNLSQAPIGISDKGTTEWRHDNKCFICLKKFGLGARHHCRYCGNSVCGNHSAKKNIENNQEKIRICDNCDIEMIKAEIREEINEDLAKLHDSIEVTKETYQKVEEERIEKTKIAQEIEEKLIEAEKKFKVQEDEVLKRLLVEQKNSQKNNDELDKITRELDESHKNEKEMTEQCTDLNEKIESSKVELFSLKESNKELSSHLESYEKRLEAGLPIEMVSQLLCENCKKRVIT